MRFARSEEQRQFAASLDDLLAGADTPTAARAWAEGRHEPGLKLARALAELGVAGLLVPEEHGGLGAEIADAVVAFEALGYHAVPGPLVESFAVAPAALTGDRLGELAAGELLASAVFPPHVPYALDADVADVVLGGAVSGGERLSSVDGTRRLFVASGTEGLPERAFELGVLAVSAQLLGLGRWLLDTSAEYARQRRQYGKPIGQYQAVKHLLADVVTGLELARPLAYGAAVTMAPRDVSAARLACSDAAYLAARTALQVHGAVGYTAEHDLGLWLTKVRALRGAWGSADFHRRRVLR